jgi:hypothetical protein
MFRFGWPRCGNSILTSMALLGLILPLAALAGCRQKNPMPTAAEENAPILTPPVVSAPDRQPAQNKPAISPIAVTVAADKARYGRGEVVTFTVTARNNSDRPQAITFNSGRSFNVSATREGKTDATWRWSDGKMFTMALRTLVLQPAEAKSFSGTWEQRGEDGPAPRGRYTITGELATQPPLLSAPITIELIG